MKEFAHRVLKQIKLQIRPRGSKVLPPIEDALFAEKAEKLLLTDLNAIYVVIPKTGCTSVKRFFSDYYSWDIVSQGPHNPSSEISRHIFNEDLQQDKYRKYFIFTFVRNPFSRLYSAYKSKLRNDGIKPIAWIDGVAPGLYKMGVRKEFSFIEFVELVCRTPDWRSDPHVKSQWQFIVSNEGKLLVDKLYRFESYRQDFLRVLRKLGIKTAPHMLPHENKTQSRQGEYINHFNKRMVNLVVRRYKFDFELFEYPKSL